MLLALLVLAAATQTPPLEELRSLELDLEQARIVIPASFDRDYEQQFFGRILEIGKLDAKVTFEQTATAPLELWRAEVTGRGSILDAAFLLHALSRRESRLTELESMTADGETFKASFTLPVFTAGPEVHTVQELLARRRMQRDAIAALQSRKRLADAAGLMDAWPFGEGTLRVTKLDVGEAMRVEGVSLGTGPRATLLAKLKDAGFSVTRMQLPPSGVCRPFVVTAVYGSQPVQIVDDATLKSPLCEDASLPSIPRIAARGTNGPITLQLRKVELPDVFYALHQLTGESFLVESDVSGRVDVELENATLDEALAAMKGIVITNEPLHRVSLTPKRAMTQKYEGEPVSFALSEQNISSIFCALEEVTGLKVLIAPELARTVVTMYAKDIPWDRSFEAMVIAANATYKIEGNQIVIGSGAKAMSTCEAIQSGASTTYTSALLTLDQLAKSDVEVAGVAKQDGKWKGWLRGPRHRLWLVEPGEKLYDTKVKSVSAGGVVFE